MIKILTLFATYVTIIAFVRFIGEEFKQNVWVLFFFFNSSTVANN